MNILSVILVLLCTLGSDHPEKKHAFSSFQNLIHGNWKSEGIQIQYIVDSHLVFEQKISGEKGNQYKFYEDKVVAQNPDGTITQGKYVLIKEDEEQKVKLDLAGNINSFTLISVTPTHLVWQKDLEDVTYNEGAILKSAERAVYTEIFKKMGRK